MIRGSNDRFHEKNDMISSIEVYPGWTMVVFEHAYFKGRQQKLVEGKYDMNQLKIGNDAISSVKCTQTKKQTKKPHRKRSSRLQQQLRRRARRRF